MATKTAMANRDEGPFKKPKFFEGATGAWNNFTGFLSDVRAEMRKVVAPSGKEVKTTTAVVIVTVIIFGVFFLIVDQLFNIGIDGLLRKLGGME